MTPLPDDLFSLPFEEERGRPGSNAERGPQRRILTVSELTASIRGVLESAFADVWVEGEISNCRVWNTGHLYFTLTDGGSQIKAVMFRSAVRYLRFSPQDGLRVVARGKVAVYDPKGEYQLVCEHLQPHGLGALQLAFDQLKARLEREGLFDQGRKRPLPVWPRKIGIVTSLDGAAIRDIIKVLDRRHPTAHLVVRPARVQGEGAASDLARAMRAIAKVPGIDVIIVGRGGGAIEDLWAFNEEVLARAIVASPVPVVSAVGHEVDFTIADFVADVRAPTPSAAAEIVVAAKIDVTVRIDRLAARLRAAAHRAVERRRGQVHALTSRRGLAGWTTRLAMRGRHAAELTHRLRRAAIDSVARRDRPYRSLRLRLEARDPGRHLAAIRGRLTAAGGRLSAAGRLAHHRADARLRALAGRLETLSPLAVLSRGYAVCWNEDRTAIIRRASSVAAGDRLRVTLQDGEIRCDVRGTDS